MLYQDVLTDIHRLPMIRNHEDAYDSDVRRPAQGVQAEMRVRGRGHGYDRQQAD